MDVSPDGEGEESWDMKKVMSYAELAKDGTIKCSTEDCILLQHPSIARLSQSCSGALCLDCQVVDYGGWPEKLEEIPMKGTDKRTQAHNGNEVLPLIVTCFPNVS
jgi:hypothetical protein